MPMSIKLNISYSVQDKCDKNVFPFTPIRNNSCGISNSCEHNDSYLLQFELNNVTMYANQYNNAFYTYTRSEHFKRKMDPNTMNRLEAHINVTGYESIA